MNDKPSETMTNANCDVNIGVKVKTAMRITYSLYMYALFFALYALKIQTCAYHVRSKNQQYANSFRFYVYSDKKNEIPLKLSQNDKLSASFVLLLCQQSKSSYNINAAFDRSILHIMQYIYVASVVTCIPYTRSPFSASVRQIVYQRFIHEV